MNCLSKNVTKSVLQRLAPLAVAAATIVSGCTKDPVDVRLKVTVVTNQGDQVAGADVKIDGVGLGTTDTHGVLVAMIKAKPMDKVRLEITKQSDAYYFAPYYEVFTIKESGTQEIATSATLFYVPKPKPDTAVAPSPPEPAPTTAATTPASSEPAKPVDVVPVPSAAEQSFNVYALAKNEPVSNVVITVGGANRSTMGPGCTTNERGHCVISFTSAMSEPVVLSAQRAGYRTATTKTKLTDGGNARFTLEPGETIDVYAMSRVFGASHGMSGVIVSAKGKVIGETDNFGHLSFAYSEKKGQLFTVRMRSYDFLPEQFETDFVVSGSMSLTRYYTPKLAPVARLAVLRAQATGTMSPEDTTALAGAFDKNMRAAADKSLFAKGGFKAVNGDSLAQGLAKAQLTEASARRQGWADAALSGDVDFMIVPTVSVADPKFLEMSVVDNRGKIIASSKAKLESIYDQAAVEKAVRSISLELNRLFPHEGAVMRVNGDTITLNLGTALGRSVRVGDTGEIFGIQIDVKGRRQDTARVAGFEITSVTDSGSVATVTDRTPRAVIARGDLVVIHATSGRSGKVIAAGKKGGSAQGKGDARAPTTSNALHSRILSTGVAQANVYLNETWLGATDESGALPMPKDGKGTLRVIRQGYAVASETVNFADLKGKLNITMKPEAAFVRIESDPAGAQIIIDGKSVGKTPITTPLSVRAGFVKLELGGVPGYKTYSTVLQLDQGTLDLTGPRSIKLDRDLLDQAKAMEAANNFTEAVEALNNIPKEHSDYLLARHELGDLYMTKLEDPGRAASYFNEVTQTPAVKQFTDKHFIPSHVNEGIALFLTAERLSSVAELELAREHYLRSIATLSNVEPQLRFVAANQYAQAVHNVHYYRALAKYRLWGITKDPAVLTESVKSWREYVEGPAKSLPLAGEGRLFTENAQVYWKQANATLAKNAAEAAAADAGEGSN